MFAGSFFSFFFYAEKAVVWTQRKRGVDERSVYWQCTSLDLMFSRQFEKHGVSRFTCFRSLFGCRRSATRICTWKTNWKKKRNILLRTSEAEQKKREGSTVACFRGCHFSVTSGVLKVSRITHVYAQAVVKFWVLGSCPIFQLWKKGSSFIVTTSQLVSSVQTIVYAVSRKDLHSWKGTYQKKHWCSQKECSHFASLRLMKSKRVLIWEIWVSQIQETHQKW